MKEIFYNHDNLGKEEIDETVIRVKALLINSNNEILLGYSNKTYQFPGGHLEDNESLVQGLKREIKEETGIVLDNDNYKPFMKITYYNKNYRNTNKNKENIIYYYEIRTDKEPDINNTNLDINEIKGNYVIKKISLDKLNDVLIQSIPDNEINKIIVEEMLSVLKEKIL